MDGERISGLSRQPVAHKITNDRGQENWERNGDPGKPVACPFSLTFVVMATLRWHSNRNPRRFMINETLRISLQ